MLCENFPGDVYCMLCIELENETVIDSCLISGLNNNKIMLPNTCIMYYGNRCKNYPLKEQWANAGVPQR